MEHFEYSLVTMRADTGDVETFIAEQDEQGWDVVSVSFWPYGSPTTYLITLRRPMD